MKEETAGHPPGSVNSSDEVVTPPMEIVPTPKRRGPRTAAGKANSSGNSRKHGLLSKAAVLEGESTEEFSSLWRGLRECFQPVGSLEKILVEKLAVLWWRYRRLIISEGGEIQRGMAFVGWEESGSQPNKPAETEIDMFDGLRPNQGLMGNIADPRILEMCVYELREFKRRIEEDGFDEDVDKITLNNLCGTYQSWKDDLHHFYDGVKHMSDCSDEDRKRYGYLTPEECKKRFLEELEEQILHLDQFKKARSLFESNKLRFDSLRRNVPDASVLEHLVRYETNLERAIDRTLSQLERHQRIRLGQPVPPPIDVKLSTS